MGDGDAYPPPPVHPLIKGNPIPLQTNATKISPSHMPSLILLAATASGVCVPYCAIVDISTSIRHWDGRVNSRTWQFVMCQEYGIWSLFSVKVSDVGFLSNKRLPLETLDLKLVPLPPVVSLNAT